MGVIESLTAPFRRGREPSAVARPAPRSGFMRDNRGPVFGSGWRPQLRESFEDVRTAWPDATARTIDLMQNVGWIAGGIEQGVANTVGTGLRLDAKPDPKLFGDDPKAASKWAKLVEQRFAIWANNPFECDVEARRKFGQQQAAGLRSYFATGELVAEYPWRRRTGETYATKTRIVPPMRLTQKSDSLTNMVQGVTMNADGMPLAYTFIRKTPDGFEREVILRARDREGRPVVTHSFDGMPGQVRGITPLVPALAVAKQFDQLSNATLMQSIIRSVFGATITSPEYTDAAVEGLLTPQEQAKMAANNISKFDAWFEAQSGWYDQTDINVGVAGRIAHLFPGQKLEFQTSDGAGPNFKDYALFLLREMARALGITYESMTGDYAGVTFSSVRFATDEIWRIVMSRREFIVSPFCQSSYSAWLEEEIDSGGVPFPGGIENFIMNRTAACHAEWKGSPKPQADEGVAARADETHLKMGTKSEFQIASDNGRDYEDVVAEREQAAALRKEAGLDDPILGQQKPDATDEKGGQRDGGKPPKKVKEDA